MRDGKEPGNGLSIDMLKGYHRVELQERTKLEALDHRVWWPYGYVDYKVTDRAVFSAN